MNILYTLNDKFVPQVGTGICSICENNKEIDKINFYVISYGITDGNKIRLKKLVKKYKRSISIIELDDLNKYFDFDFDTLGWNKVILARLLMGSILPNNINRIIYLDGDTIVRGNLKNLWDTDIKENVIAMSIEPTVDKKRKESLGLKNYPYHNSGVLLVDLEKWRKNDVQKRIIDYYKEQNGRLFAADQDALNVVLKDEIYNLSIRYNYYNIFDQYSFNFCSKLMKPLNYSDYISKEEYYSSRKNPCVIHFLGEERPWRIGNTHKYRNDYKKYLNLTPWKNTEDEKGWKVYFFCWRIFNVLTRPFPFIRYNIINSLIPKFMNYRKKKIVNEKKG